MAPNFLVLCSLSSGSLFLQTPWFFLSQFFSPLCQLRLFRLLVRCLCSLEIHRWLSSLFTFNFFLCNSFYSIWFWCMMPNLYLNVLCSDWPRYCISRTFQRVSHESPHRYLKLKKLTELITLLPKPNPLPTFSSSVMYLFYPSPKLGCYYLHLSVSHIPTHWQMVNEITIEKFIGWPFSWSWCVTGLGWEFTGCSSLYQWEQKQKGAPVPNNGVFLVFRTSDHPPAPSPLHDALLGAGKFFLLFPTAPYVRVTKGDPAIEPEWLDFD